MSMYECDERNGRGLYMCFWPNWNASWVSYGCFGCTNSNFGRFEQYEPIAIADTWFICAHNIQRRSEFIVCALMQSTHNDDNNKKHDAIKYGFSLFRMATHNFAWAFLLLCTIFMNSTCVLHVGWTFYRQMIRESISFNPIRGRWYSTWVKMCMEMVQLLSFGIIIHSISLLLDGKKCKYRRHKKPLTYTHTFMHQSKTSTEHICLRIALL